MIIENDVVISLLPCASLKNEPQQECFRNLKENQEIRLRTISTKKKKRNWNMIGAGFKTPKNLFFYSNRRSFVKSVTLSLKKI